MKQNTSQRIAQDIKRRIRAGDIRPGERVPSARDLVKSHGVAIATASKVLAILKREGLVKPERGIGTVVRANDRRNELTRDQIVRAGLAIADEEGLDAVTLRQVAIELSVSTLALQRVIESKDELVLAITDAVLGDVPLPKATGAWRSVVEGTLRAQWSAYLVHPWMAGALSMTRPQLLPNGMRHTETLLAALDTLGLGPAITLRTAVTLLAYTRGMAIGLESERQAEQDTGMSSEEWMDARESLFAPLAPRFPTLTRLSRQPGIDMTLGALFERGLTLLLDGIAHTRKETTAKTPRSPRHAKKI